jgi:hypothetical protein
MNASSCDDSHRHQLRMTQPYAHVGGNLYGDICSERRCTGCHCSFLSDEQLVAFNSDNTRNRIQLYK